MPDFNYFVKPFPGVNLEVRVHSLRQALRQYRHAAAGGATRYCESHQVTTRATSPPCV